MLTNNIFNIKIGLSLDRDICGFYDWIIVVMDILMRMKYSFVIINIWVQEKFFGGRILSNLYINGGRNILEAMQHVQQSNSWSNGCNDQHSYIEYVYLGGVHYPSFKSDVVNHKCPIDTERVFLKTN